MLLFTLLILDLHTPVYHIFSNAGMGQQDFDLPKDPEEEAYLAQKMLEEAERKLLEAAELQYKGLMSVQITLEKIFYLYHILFKSSLPEFIYHFYNSMIAHWIISFIALILIPVLQK